MLTTQKLSHQYHKGQGFQFPDFSCHVQETLLVLGQSGVGKTTLLHILAGILKPTSGEVLIDDTSIYKQATNKLDKFRGQHIGLVFQKPHFVQAINARENLLLAQRVSQQKVDTSKIDHLLNQLNIAHRSTAKVYKMSQGEQQRLSIARALANDPKVILADEPTSALDDKNCDEVINLLHRQAEAAQAALIIVTHDNRLKEYFTNHIELN